MSDLQPYKIEPKHGKIVIDVNQDAIDRARRLIAEGWCQTSSKYRSVARLPEGKTGMEALCEANGTGMDEALYRWDEASAGDSYLRSNSVPIQDRMELDPATWQAYKKLGGGTYHRHVPKGYQGKRLHNADMSLQVVMEAALELWEQDPAWFRKEIVTDRAQFVDILEQLELRKCAGNARTYARMWGFEHNTGVYRRWEDEKTDDEPEQD